MAPWRFPGWAAMAESAARAIGWLFFADDYCRARLCRAALAKSGWGCGTRTPSWQAVALAEPQLGFPSMSPARCMVHDMFSLGVSLGGVVMVMLASVNVPDNDDTLQGASSTGSGVADQRFTQHRMLRASMWLLTVVVILRLAFGAWACVEFVMDFRRSRARLLRRRDS
ncbi:hypothetical protein ACCO45_010178 [Purpureocillium lilacinum]|uniref:Uncharacterized protein n=1 Tax=Purpureocillium lilacinum TaxID=33203 RepID=A0ACC4DE25_PURLI